MIDIEPRTRLLIDGAWEDDRATLPVVAPWSGEELSRMALGTTDDVDRAVAAARSALRRPFTASERAGVLDRAAVIVARDRDHLAATIALEAAKPIRAARVEVDRCVETLRFSATEARTLHGETLPLDAHPSGGGLVGFTIREPAGVVAAVAPFNFPLNLVAHKLGPAIAAGCPVVLKPAEKTPLSGLALVERLLEAGLPRGFIQVVTGLGSDVGAYLGQHPGVDVVSFTGSAAVGHALAAANPGAKVLLELGSAAPIVLERDGDLAAVADRVTAHAFAHAGQSCVSVQRVLVHADLHDRFGDELVARTRRLVVGDPMAEDTDLACLIRDDAAARVAAWIDEALEAGAVSRTGGTRTGATIAPTVLDEVPTTVRLWTEEIFGPVVAIVPFTDQDEAVAAIEAGPDLIQVGVFTADLNRALAYVHRLRAGTVLVNESPTFRLDHLPYGGVGAAGNTREGPRSAVRELTVDKLVILRAGPA